jgi:asparagine synthase (glutamine-hydrolysing)
MCGILGQVSHSREINHDHAVLDCLQHRGPDARGIYETSHCFLGHTRLSIIDLDARSNQPFSDSTGRYQLVFNGEIYNYRELKKDLEDQGVLFQTTSDTEVVLHLLIREGNKALSKLNGFFALGFWDETTKTVLLARDRFGIKPLLYHTEDGVLSFSSELQGLFSIGVKASLNQQAISEFLQYTYVSAPNTILNGVHKLLPGHFAEFELGNVSCQSWYDQTQATTETSLHDELVHAVDRRMIADVSVGSFLSGGIDSSLIAAIAARSKPDLKTFSISFPEFKYLDESPHAKLVARHIGSDHTNIEFSAKEMIEAIEGSINALDEPFADSSSLAVFLLSAETCKHVKVALSGDGADELFAGYRKHLALFRSSKSDRSASLMKALSRLMGTGGSRESRLSDRKRQLARYVRGLDMSFDDRYWYWAAFAERMDADSVLNSARSLALPAVGDFEGALRMDQAHVLTNDMLRKVDLMSMSHGLEVRTPFLDHHVVERARAYPMEALLSKRKGKLPLRSIAREYLPDEIIDRRKQGFEIPIQSWLGNEIKYMVEECLDPSQLDEAIFDRAGVADIKQRFQKGEGSLTPLVWSMIVIQKWLDKNRDYWWVS